MDPRKWLGHSAREQRLVEIEARLHRLSDRITSQRDVINKQRQILSTQRERLDRQRKQLDEIRDSLDAVKLTVATLKASYAGVEHQSAALTTRLERLSESLQQTGPESTDAERSEARRLLEQVREEHSRIRVRFGVVTRYEERLRRLEETAKLAADVEG